MLETNELRHQLHELAQNYRWTWDRATQAIFDALPPAPPEAGPHPLARVEAVTTEALLETPGLGEAIGNAYGRLIAERAQAPHIPRVAYFSPEFALSEVLPQYSGGLGVLAGDHLKAASDQRLPLVGVGLMYREGFFHQAIEGARQVERYESVEPDDVGLTDTGIRVRVDLAGEEALVAAWRVCVGSVPLYLLDTDLPENPASARSITNRLYAGDRLHRLRQEMVLGIGGVRVLRALGVHPDVFHLNEGHSGFLVLELLHDMLAAGRSLEDALALLRPRLRFTTHTPVPAGIERFPNDLLHPYIDAWARRHEVEPERLFALGRFPGDDHTFNLAAFCLRVAGYSNGVSKLHGEVSRSMFTGIPGGRAIGSVTNGVHARSWVAPELQATFDEQLGPEWASGAPEAWAAVERVSREAVVEARRPGRARLLELMSHAAESRVPPRPEALTIGFARRFATYKRAALLMEHPDRLERLLGDPERPVQFVFAGKAHPDDGEGKAVLHRIVEFSRSPASHGRVVFLPDYDMAVARAMYAGCDVWLNNPLRPHEACGTSGMKAALNGAINCSTLDGWWDELFDGRNGWAIPTFESLEGHERDLAESTALLDLLEREIVPLYYQGNVAFSPAWFERVRQSWRSLGPAVTAARMVEEYARLYGLVASRA